MGSNIAPAAVELLRAEFRQRYGNDVPDGWLVLDHWVRLIFNHSHRSLFQRGGHLNVWDFIIILVAFGIMGPSICVATTLATLTYRHIIRAKTLSLRTRASQLRILVAVCAQVQSKSIREK